jgi:hypothetical protein
VILHVGENFHNDKFIPSITFQWNKSKRNEMNFLIIIMRIKDEREVTKGEGVGEGVGGVRV